MRQEYQYKATEIITAGHDLKVYGKRVKAGWLLKVICCYFYVPEIGTVHNVAILVETGAQDLDIRWRGKEVGRLGISTLNPFYVFEHQRVVGYAPNAVTGNKLSLTVIGEIIPLKKWRKGKV